MSCSLCAHSALAPASPLLVDGVESGVSGTACVKKDGDGIVFAGHLEGLLPDTTGGFHIHSGENCCFDQPANYATPACQGGHYWEDINDQCLIFNDPWVSDAPFYSRWGTTAGLTTANPINTKPGIVAGGQNSDGETGFTIGTADNLCGVEGKAVIVHRGGDGTTGSPGTRVACGILTQA